MNWTPLHAFLLVGLTGCVAPTSPSDDSLSAGSAGPESTAVASRFPRAGWPGHGLCYSGFREGQSPHGPHPDRAQVREDLHLLAPHWSMLRTYAASSHSRDVLEVIRQDRLDLRVLLGIWLATEDPAHASFRPDHRARNDAEVEAALALAAEFPDIVAALAVGNEVLVDWSFQPVPPDRVIELVRRVRARTTLPVTVADNYKAWTTPAGRALAREVDFVSLHSYPLWVRQGIDQALATTRRDCAEVRAAVGPDRPLVLTEAGWATHTTPGDPLHLPGAGSEENQLAYYRQLLEWTARENLYLFWFEAFDEPWKGPGTEGHWGLYDVQRRPKQALRVAGPPGKLH